MSALVLFDSDSGNTTILAETIAAELGGQAMPLPPVGTVGLVSVDLLVLGSPITARKPTDKMRSFLSNLGKGTLNGVRAAAFDTRVRVFIHGDAAAKISHTLHKAGAEIVARPRGFIVEGREGPLAAGAVEQAATWAHGIAVASHGDGPGRTGLGSTGSTEVTN